MTTLLAVFLTSLILAAAFSPLVRLTGFRLGALDYPGQRKVHQQAVPRIGGLAIFSAFFLTLGLTQLINNPIVSEKTLDVEKIAFLAGAALCFATGLVDDFRSLKAKKKLALQILAAVVAFWGGLRIHFPMDLQLPSTLALGLSLGVTVFWFLLFVNAVNLIDGLDGLAGGVVLFTCLVMFTFLVLSRDYSLALCFAVLGGAVLGFLPYNFSSVGKLFLGDGGSYFLGYSVAGLAVMGSVKTQVGATILIPLVAMGLPVFETIISPVRRMILDKHPFQPDKEHIHHRLLTLGLSTRKAVVFLYGLTALLCLAAIVMVNLKDEQVGLFLVILGAVLVLLMRGAGLGRYLDLEKTQSWLRDVGFVTGLSRDRRRFLGLQMEVSGSRSLGELWESVCRALRDLDMDFAEMRLSRSIADRSPEKGDQAFRWSREGFDVDQAAGEANLFKLELPLQNGQRHEGDIWILKDLDRSPFDHYTLTRIEHLRRSISRALSGISRQRGSASVRRKSP